MSENFKINQDLDIDKSINSFIPAGSIIIIGGNTYLSNNDAANIGLIPCDGQAVSRTTYANLFSVIGTTYGVGDGSTTFNVPNLYTASKFISMKDSSTNLGSTAGSNTHTHTINSNATGTTTSDGFDHTHTSYAGTGNGGDHYHYLGAAYMGMNSAAAHVGPGYKKDGPNSLASINHNHAMYFNAINMNWGGNHSHPFYFNHGSSTGTSHSHSFTTSGTLGSAVSTKPPYVSALAYIKY